MEYRVKDCRKYSDDFYKKMFDSLTWEQKKKIATLKRCEDRMLSILGLTIACEMLHCLPSDITYKKKKPVVQNGHISVTHKYPYVGVAVSIKPCGIDIETVRVLDETTIKYLRATNSIDALIKWTRKEAVYKADESVKCKIRTCIIEKEYVLSVCERVA